MKSCNEIRELISLYLDNQLDKKLGEEFEEHINRCSFCKEELEETRNIVSMINSIEEEELPENFKSDLHKKLVEVKTQQEGTQKFRLLKNRYLKVISTAAACLLVLVLLKGFAGNINMNLKPETAKSADMSVDFKSEEVESAQAGNMENSVSEAKKDEYGSEAKAAPVEKEKKETSTAEAKKDTQRVQPKNKGEVKNGSAGGAGKDEKTSQAEKRAKTFAGDSGEKKEKSTEAVPNEPADNPPSDGGTVQENQTMSIMAADAPEESEAADVADSNKLVNKSVGITIKIDNPEEAKEKIKLCAAKFGIDAASAKIASQDASLKAVGQESEQVRLRVPGAQFEEFSSSLKESFSQSYMEFGEIKVEDASGKLGELEKELEEIDKKIDELDAAKDTRKEEELGTLKEQRQEILSKMDQVQKDSEYVYITIIIIKPS